MPAMSVLAALTISVAGSNYHHQNMIPERLLATPPVCERESGVLWHSRSAIAGHPAQRDCGYGRGGPASYGAPADAADDLVYVRVDHMVIAISPWEQFTEQGHQKLERARVLWLKERGLVGGVRTHVNAAYQHAGDGHAEHAASKEIEPRAIIHIRERIPANNEPLRAHAAPRFKVIVPAETAVAEAPETTDAG